MAGINHNPTRREFLRTMAATAQDPHQTLDALALPDAVLRDLTDAIAEIGQLPLEMLLHESATLVGDDMLIDDNAASVQKVSPAEQLHATPLVHVPMATSVSSISAPVPVAMTPVARPPMKNPSRERMKAELASLRKQVVELERQVEYMEDQKEKKRDLHDKQWKEAADQQLSKRRRSETENRRLWASLTKQISIAKSYERALQNQQLGELEGFYDGDEDPLEETQEALFNRLERGTIRAYAAVDRVLDQCGFSSDDVPALVPSRATVRRNTQSGRERLFVEYVDTKFVPFDLKRTSDAFWRVLTSKLAYKEYRVDAIETINDTIRIKYAYSYRHMGQERPLYLTGVFKKVVEPDRMLVVWRAIVTDPPASNDAIVSGKRIGSDETGWIVVKELAGHAAPFQPLEELDQRNQRYCVMQTCSRHVPLWQTSGDNDPAIGEYTSMVLSASDGDVAAITSAMETLLFAEALTA